MPNNSLNDIDVDEIMEKIREEVAKRKSATPGADSGGVYRQRGTGNEKRNVHLFILEDFLKYHDEEFIKNAYHVILKRTPDPEGYKTYLTRLRSGELSKTDILGRLRYSKEGREKRTQIRGLLLRTIISASFRIPIIGYIIDILVLLARLPKILKNNREFESYTNIRLTQLSQVDEEIRELFSSSSKATLKTLTTISTAQQAVEKITSAITTELNYYKLNMLEQERRLFLFLEEARKRLPEPFTAQQLENMLTEEDHLLDAMYLTFEDRFRGTRGDIKERLKTYLPYIEQLSEKNKDAPLLDIGCGRGEWLELLKEKGYKAQGVDLNRIMIQQCKDRGLDVMEADVIAFLRKQEANSLRAITGFHIIEHLTLRTLVTLFDEALRVLAPGGLVIFETPNPENIVVGACNFYIDPTHRNPLPPDPIKFIAEQRGFVRVEILRLHRLKEIQPTGQELLDDVLHRFTMEQDYSIIGYKE